MGRYVKSVLFGNVDALVSVFKNYEFAYLSMFCFFFNDTATTEIYTLSLHDALPIFLYCQFLVAAAPHFIYCPVLLAAAPPLFIFTNSRCGSAPASYTALFSLRQRPA